MGQQQLILTVLVAVVVGIATIVALNTMSNSHQSANHNAVRQHLLEAASEAQMYYLKDEAMGGGGKSFLNISLSDIKLDSVQTAASFSISEISANSFTLTAEPRTGGGPFVAVISKDDISITP